MASHVVVDVLEGRNFDTANPYISFTIHEKKYKTKLAKRTAAPKWNETFVFDNPNLNEIVFTLYDSKLSVKLGISQLRVKVGTVIVPITSATPRLASSSSSSSATPLSLSSSTSSLPGSSGANPSSPQLSSATSAKEVAPIVVDDWFKIEREKTAKPNEKPHPFTEIHLRVEVVPGPMARSGGLEHVRSNDSYINTATDTMEDSTLGGAYSSDEEHDMKPRSIERKSIKMENSNSTKSLPSPPGSPTSTYSSPASSPAHHMAPSRPLPTPPTKSPDLTDGESKDKASEPVTENPASPQSKPETLYNNYLDSGSEPKADSSSTATEDNKTHTDIVVEINGNGIHSPELSKSTEQPTSPKHPLKNLPQLPPKAETPVTPNKDSEQDDKQKDSAKDDKEKDDKEKDTEKEKEKEKDKELGLSTSSSISYSASNSLTNSTASLPSSTPPSTTVTSSLSPNHKEVRVEAPRRKKKKEPPKPKVPTRLVESFFVVGMSANLDPIDDRYEYHPAASPVDMIYKGNLLDCYPKVSDSFPPHIWMFCLPRGLQLLRHDPGPSFFPFVLTSLDGTRLFGSCLTFYEPVAEAVLVELWKKMGRDSASLKFTDTIYAPKCIGTLSRFPFYTAFRDWLSELYDKAFYKPSTVPLERYIYHLFNEVPLPIAGGPPVQINIGDKVLNCLRPAETSFPLADLPFHLLFEVLDVGNVLTVFSCILQEEKVVLTSSHFSVLTTACEIFSALLYPFEWVHVYVPILPELLLDFVYSPTPFIMGAHKNYLAPIKEELSEELVIVDLDNNRIQFGTRTVAPFPTRELQQITWELQRVVKYRIACTDYPGYNPAHDHNKEFTNFIPPVGPAFNEYIRFIFLKFFTSIFRDYRKYLMYLRVFPKPIAVFNKIDFLKSKPDATEFMKAFMETQSFTSFLENHSWPTYQLFDEWLATKKFNLTLEDISNPKADYIKHTILPQTEKKPTTPDKLYQYRTFPSLNPDLLSLATVFPAPPTAPPPQPAPSNLYNPFKQPPNAQDQKSDQSTTETDKSPTIEQQDKHDEQDKQDTQDKQDKQEKRGTILITNTTEPTEKTEKAPDPPKDVPKEVDPHEATEEGKALRQVVQKFVDALYDNPTSLDQGDTVHQITDALKFDYGRSIFGKVLLGDHRIAGEKGEGGRLSEHAFNILGEVLHAALREAHSNLDHISPQLYLVAITKYHRISNGAQEYLFTKVKTQDMWQNHLFWEKCFFDKVELECKKLYNNDIEGKMKGWPKLTPEDQEKIVNAEETMIFNLVFSFAFNMVNLSLPVDTLRRFVTKISLGAALNDEHFNIIMQLVANMARAKEIEDEAMAQHEHEPAKQDTNLKMHFSKQDNYLPVGMASLDESGKGRELFTTLVEEKSVPLVGTFRPIGKKLSLKSKWNEKTAGKYQEVSEERGGYVIKTFTGHKEAVLCCTPGAGGKEAMRLVTGSCDCKLIVWDMLKCQNLGELEGHSGWVNLCEVEPDGLRVLSGSYDRSVKLWDLIKMQKVRTMRGHKGSISCLKAGAGKTCMSASYDNTLMLWDYRHQKSVMSFVGHQGPVMSMVWDAHENRLISGSRDTTVRTWDVRTGKCIYNMVGHTDWVKCLVVENDLLLSGSCDGSIKVWSLDSGQCNTTLHGHSGSVNAIQLWNSTNEAVSPKFITASTDCSLKVWDMNYAGCYQTLQGHTDEVVACSRFLSNCIASAAFDGNIRIWDPEQGKPLRTIAAHTHRITTLGVYDQAIITGSWDKTAKVCEFGLDFRV